MKNVKQTWFLVEKKNDKCNLLIEIFGENILAFWIFFGEWL